MLLCGADLVDTFTIIKPDGEYFKHVRKLKAVLSNLFLKNRNSILRDHIFLA
jgi:hypothetical protein